MSVHMPKNKVCDICGNTYKNAVSLYSHRRSAHTEIRNPLEVDAQEWAPLQ
jgi:hypothetical protein